MGGCCSEVLNSAGLFQGCQPGRKKTFSQVTEVYGVQLRLGLGVGLDNL